MNEYEETLDEAVSYFQNRLDSAMLSLKEEHEWGRLKSSYMIPAIVPKLRAVWAVEIRKRRKRLRAIKKLREVMKTK